MISSLTTLALALAALPVALSQNTGDAIVYDTLHNITSLYGTWSTGSGNVVTGSVSALPDLEITRSYLLNCRTLPSLARSLSHTQPPRACLSPCELFNGLFRRLSDYS